MKVVLFVLVLCFSLNCVVAFSWFNFGAKPVTKPVNTYRSTTFPQQSAVQHQSQVKNLADSQRQPVIASRTNPINRSSLQRARVQQQLTPHRAVNVQRQQNQLKNATAAQRQALADAKAKQTPLQRALTQRQSSFRTAIGVRRQQDQLRTATANQRQAAISSQLNRVNRTSLQRPSIHRQQSVVGQQNPVKTVAGSNASRTYRTQWQRILNQQHSASRIAAGAQRQQSAVGQQQSQVKNAADSPRQTMIVSKANQIDQTPLQGGLIQQRQPSSHNANNGHYQADNTRKQNSPSLNNHAVNNTSNRLLNPRFRSFVNNRQSSNTAGLPANRRTSAQTSLTRAALAESQPKNPLLARNSVQSHQYRTENGKGNARSTKTGALYRALTAKVTSDNKVQNEQRIPANPYFQQRWRALHLGPSPHSKIHSPVQRRKREDQSDDAPPRLAYGIIFSRNEPLNDEYNNPY